MDDIYYEVECSMVIPGRTVVDIGANPSAEEEEEAPLEEGEERVIDVVHYCRLGLAPGFGPDDNARVIQYKGHLKARPRVASQHDADADSWYRGI